MGPNHFGWVPIVWDRSNSFWLGPDHFGWVQMIKISPEKSNWNLIKMICKLPKPFGINQNSFLPSKTIWMFQNHWKDKSHFSSLLACRSSGSLKSEILVPVVLRKAILTDLLSEEGLFGELFKSRNRFQNSLIMS